MHVPVLLIIAFVGLMWWPWYVSLGIFVIGIVIGEIYDALWVPPPLRKEKKSST